MENAGPGSRGTGSRGVEKTGSGGKHGVWKRRGVVEKTGSGGKDGVWWKTRGLRGKHGVYLENTRYHFFRQNMNFPLNINSAIRSETRFSIKKAN